MKKSIFLIAFLFFTFSHSLWAESDTLWTKYIGSTVRTVKFSPDGLFVYAAAEGRGPLKLDANTGEILMEYPGFTYSDYAFNNAIDISSDSKMLIGGDFHKLYLYDSENGKLQDSLESNTMNFEHNRFNEVLFTKDNQYVIACLDYGTSTNNPPSKLLVWDLKTKKIVYEQTKYRIHKISIDSFSNKLAYMNGFSDIEDCVINLLEIGTWKELGVLKGHQNRITDLSFSPDGSILASSDFDTYLVKIWDIEKQKLLMSFKPNGTFTYCVGLIDNNLLVSCSGIWEELFLRSNNINSKNEVYSTKYYASNINFYKNEKVILASSKTIILLKADKLSSIPFTTRQDKLFPNPTNQNLTIPKSYFTENFLYFNIIDMTGKEVHKHDTFNQFNEDMTLDVSQFIKGSYIIQFFYKNSSMPVGVKFIKDF
jgi:hypothetical protein